MWIYIMCKRWFSPSYVQRFSPQWFKNLIQIFREWPIHQAHTHVNLKNKTLTCSFKLWKTILRPNIEHTRWNPPLDEDIRFPQVHEWAPERCELRIPNELIHQTPNKTVVRDTTRCLHPNGSLLLTFLSDFIQSEGVEGNTSFLWLGGWSNVTLKLNYGRLATVLGIYPEKKDSWTLPRVFWTVVRWWGWHLSWQSTQPK